MENKSSVAGSSFVGSVLFWIGIYAILKLIGFVGYSWEQVAIYGLVTATAIGLIVGIIALLIIVISAVLGGGSSKRW